MKGIKIANKLAEAVSQYHKGGSKVKDPADMKEDNADQFSDEELESPDAAKLKKKPLIKKLPKAKQPEIES